MNIPDINVNAIVLVAIAVLLIFLVLLVFLGARENADRFDETWDDHYRAIGITEACALGHHDRCMKDWCVCTCHKQEGRDDA